MSALTFLILVMLALAVATLLLPVGKDLAVALFFLPWGTLTADLGANVQLSKLLIAIVVVKALLGRYFNVFAMPGARSLGMVLLIGVASTLISLVSLESNSVFAGGELRNGLLRVAVALSNFMLTLVLVPLFLAPSFRLSVRKLLRIYLSSVVVLCIIGVLQFFIYLFTGTDILPIGIFAGSEEDLRSGWIEFSNVRYLRPSSLAGEPKNLGMFAASAIIIAIGFVEELALSFRVRWATIFICLFALFLTQSTSALLSIVIGFAVFGGLRLLGRPLTRRALFVIYAASSMVLLSVYFYKVEFEKVTIEMRLAEIASLRERGDVLDVLYARTLGRLEVEDFDWVIVKSFLEEPSALAFGRGFGVAHLFVGSFIPQELRYYMEGRVIVPKSGIILILVNGGLISYPFMLMFLVSLMPSKIRAFDKRATDAANHGIRRVQSSAVPLVILFLMRAFTLDVVMFVSACALLSSRLMSLPHIRSRGKIIDPRNTRLWRGNMKPKPVSSRI